MKEDPLPLHSFNVHGANDLQVQRLHSSVHVRLEDVGRHECPGLLHGDAENRIVGNGEFREALRYYQKSMKLDGDVQAQRNKEQSLQHLSDSILLVSTEIMHDKEISYQK